MLKGQPVTILLIEDDPAHAEIVRRNLAEFRVGNRIIHLADGQAALDYFQRARSRQDTESSPMPDLILLDLRLPKVDGQQVLRFLKADPEWQRIPTVILTTSKAEQDLLGAYSHGASSYLVKPVDFAKFASLMEAFGFYWLAWNEYPTSTPPPR